MEPIFICDAPVSSIEVPIETPLSDNGSPGSITEIPLMEPITEIPLMEPITEIPLMEPIF
jgi:hypothetical protein